MVRKNKVLSVVMIGICLVAAGCGFTDNTSTQSNMDLTLEKESEDSASGKDNEVVATRDIFAMDTYMTLSAYGEHGEQAVEQAEQLIEELDERLSTGNPESEISKLNRDGKAILSEDTYAILKQALSICEQTDGAFHPAIYPLMELWGFPTKEFRVPDEKEIEQKSSLLDIEEIYLEDDTCTVSFGKEGMKVDLGGIAKGYTSSKVIDSMREAGVTSALINLGGNVQTLGTKPDGRLWNIAIRNPDENQGYLGVLETSDKAVITSGGYERYFEEEGIIYHHILDPATGYPANNGLTSVTIVSGDGMLADGLSTSLYVMGSDRAIEFWRENGDMFDMILLTDQDELYVTEGIAESFSSTYEFDTIYR